MKKMLTLILLVIITSFPDAVLPENPDHPYQLLTNNLEPHILQVPGGKIEYYRFGHGAPLVLITGYFANVKSWNMTFLKLLSTKNDVIIFDNRNVGGSFNLSKNYSTSDLAGDVGYLLKALHLSHANILGISMGGMIAQQFAILYPDKVDHLILINTFIAGIQPALPDKQIEKNLYKQPSGKLRQYIMALRLLFPPDARFKMFFTFAKDRFNPHSKEVSLSPTVIRQQQKLVLGWINNTAALQKIRQIKIPVLILSGGSDYIIPYYNTDVLHKEIRHSKLVRWKQGGHAMIFQYPESIANTINQWLHRNELQDEYF